MTGHKLSTSNGVYTVVETHNRLGGTVDLIVSYRPRGRRTTYTAYRYEPDGAWKCLNGGWVDIDIARDAAQYRDEYRPLVSPELREFLASAIGVRVPSVGGGPDIGDDAEREYRDCQDDPITPNDEGDDEQ